MSVSADRLRTEMEELVRRKATIAQDVADALKDPELKAVVELVDHQRRTAADLDKQIGALRHSIAVAEAEGKLAVLPQYKPIG